MKFHEIAFEHIDLRRFQELCELAEKNGDVFLSNCYLESEALEWLAKQLPQQFQLLRSTPKESGFFVELEECPPENLTGQTQRTMFTGFLSLLPT
jgi:hypothetical protein